MLSKDTISKIAAALRLDEAKFTEALAAQDEQALELPEVSVFTPTELKTREAKIKSQGYNEGKVAGLEMWVDDQKKAFGLDFEGKDAEKFVTSLKDKVLTDAKLKPDEKVKELESTVNTLKQNLATALKEQGEAERRFKETALKTTLFTGIPQGVPVEGEEFLYAMQRSGYSFEEGEKGIVVKKNGEALTTGATLDPVDFKTAMLQYAKDERKWISEEEKKGGRGGSSSSNPPTKYRNVKEVEAAWVADGKSLNAAEYAAHLQSAAKDAGPEFWQ